MTCSHLVGTDLWNRPNMVRTGSGPRVTWIDVDAHWSCSRAARGDCTFDTDVVEGREEVGWSWDVTLCGSDQWQQNESHINGRLG